jgi:hypothetical protein
MCENQIDIGELAEDAVHFITSNVISQLGNVVAYEIANEVFQRVKNTDCTTIRRKIQDNKKKILFGLTTTMLIGGAYILYKKKNEMLQKRKKMVNCKEDSDSDSDCEDEKIGKK